MSDLTPSVMNDFRFAYMHAPDATHLSYRLEMVMVMAPDLPRRFSRVQLSVMIEYLTLANSPPCQTQASLAQPVENDGMSPLQLLPRWLPSGEPLYHRRLSSQWHDMCAESLGMPKVALCFLTRGPVHQVTAERLE